MASGNGGPDLGGDAWRPNDVCTHRNHASIKPSGRTRVRSIAQGQADKVTIDPEIDRRSRRIGLGVAYVTFIFFYGIIVARFGLWGLLLGWLPGAAASALAGYVFYRSPWLCLVLEAILLALTLLAGGN